MIRIALIAHLSEVSGAGISLLETCSFLDRTRFDPIFVLPGEGPLSERARAAGVEVAIVENAEQSLAEAGLADKARLSAKRLDYIRRMAMFLRGNRIQLAYVNSSASIFAGLAARMAGRPIAWHIHETIREPDLSTKVKMRFIETLSDTILYASHSAEKHFPAVTVSRRLVVKNYIPVRDFANAEFKSAWSELGINAGDIVITANGLFPRKAPDVFLKAAAILCKRRQESNLKFVLLGPVPPGGEAFKTELDSIAKSSGISNRVIFAGLRADQTAILKRSAIFVSASRNEALPMMLIEAMAAGVPVIATTVGDCGELVDGGRYGVLIPPEEPESTASAMEQIIFKPEAALARTSLAQSMVMNEYGSDRFWQPLEQLLLETASSAKV